MKLKFKLATLVIASTLSAYGARAEIKVGTTAPDFSATDSSGKTVQLKDFKGKVVVLEWFNKDCPFVKKHYESGNMQKLQKDYTQKGVVWLSVTSSAVEKQGHMTAAEATELRRGKDSQLSTALLLDASGSLGKTYDAKVTPHMFVINKEGTLVYNGAIDDNRSADPKVIPSSKNYVAAALDSTLKGEKVATPSSKPYGCSVKY